MPAATSFPPIINPMITRIDLGCGEKKREGFWGVDFCPGPAVDLVLNIESERLPFEDNSIEHVFSSHTFEHLSYLPFPLQEIFRVCKDDALVEIWTPYGKSNDAFALGHQLFLNEAHWEQICYENDRLFLGESKGYFDWEKTQYHLQLGIISTLETMGIPLEFAIEHFFNIAIEWAVFLRVKKNEDRAPGRQYPQKVFSYGRDNIIKQGANSSDLIVDVAQLSNVTTNGQRDFYNVDLVNGRALPKERPLLIDASDGELTIGGWAVDPQAEVGAAGVYVSIDGKREVQCAYGLERKDVASFYNNPRYAASGWVVSIPPSLLEKGRHTLTLKVLSADRQGYYQPDHGIDVEVR
jgi:hypothetical protein